MELFYLSNAICIFDSIRIFYCNSILGSFYCCKISLEILHPPYHTLVKKISFGAAKVLRNERKREMHQTTCKTGDVNWKRVIIYFVSVLISSLFYCLPVFFEYESDYENNTIWEKEMVHSEFYAIGYYIVLDCIARFLIPVCLLLYTNYEVYKVISNQPVNLDDASYKRNAQNLMLFGVIILLVIAHAYRFALNIYQVPIYDSHHKELDCCGRDATNQIIHIGAYALLTLSCSGNCFIYLATSKPFREVALKYYRLIFHLFILLPLVRATETSHMTITLKSQHDSKMLLQLLLLELDSSQGVSLKNRIFGLWSFKEQQIGPML